MMQDNALFVTETAGFWQGAGTSRFHALYKRFHLSLSSHN